MTSNAPQAESVDKVPLKVMVDKEKNRVLWAEAGKDFVDVLFSFLTLPLGTIARLVSQKSNIEPVRFGSLSSLYQSVADLKEDCFWTQDCKEMLLRPRNSMETYCMNLKLNIDDTPIKFFRCVCFNSQYLSIFRERKCYYCSRLMNEEVSPESLISFKDGFVVETASFIISDDLRVMPYAFRTSMHLLHKFGIHNSNAVVEKIIEISNKEVIDLLKLSFLSKTPLTDLIMKEKQSHDDCNPTIQFDIVIRNELNVSKKKMSVTVTKRKSTGEFLFAEVNEDFVDFIFSFLTFPLGGVLHMLGASSSISCFDNLYNGLTELAPLDRFFLSKDLKDKLAKAQCFPNFELKDPMLPIGTASIPHYKLVDAKVPNSNLKICGEYVKGPSVFMVTDDLVVTPMTSASAISHLNKSKVPIFDLEEKAVQIGAKEGLCLLKAALISTSALGNALKTFISTVKTEKK